MEYAGRVNHLGPLLGHVEVIFVPHAKLAGNADHGFIAKTHPDFQQRFIVPHQIRRFMQVEADAVASPMRQTRQLIARTESVGFQATSRRAIDLCTWHTQARSIKSRCLCCLFRVPHKPLPIVCLTENVSARDIRNIVLVLAAGVDQDHVIAFENLRLFDPMWIRCCLPKQNDAEIRSCRTNFSMCLVYEVANFHRADSFAQNACRRPVNLQSHVFSGLHDCNLRARFVLSQRPDQSVGADQFIIPR